MLSVTVFLLHVRSKDFSPSYSGTPKSLADPCTAAVALEAAATKLQTACGALEIAWGDFPGDRVCQERGWVRSSSDCIFLPDKG